MSTYHDYTDAERRLGHDYTFTPGPDGLTASATGWGGGIKKGDVIGLTGPNGGVSPYRVERIRYMANPPDLWTARLAYVAQ